MPDFLYPTSAELQAVEQVKIPRLTADRPIFRILPIVEADTDLLMWEQKDNYLGLQQGRGINGSPKRVKNVGGKRFMTEPGYYGEFMQIDEKELTRRRQFGTFATGIDIEDLVMEKQDQLLGRRLDLIEQIGWNVLQGTYTVAAGNITFASDTYTVLGYTVPAGEGWNTPATARPLGHFRSVQLLGRGQSANFGAAAEAFMNRVTFNWLIANTNDADLYGKRTDGLANVLTLAQTNAVLAGEDLPTITIYDEGYLSDGTLGDGYAAGAFVPFIPDMTVIVIGKRPGGQSLGDYAMTRNVNNPGMAAGAYTAVIDSGTADAGAARRIPRTIEVHDGHNGGPRIYFPGSIVVMSVA